MHPLRGQPSLRDEAVSWVKALANVPSMHAATVAVAALERLAALGTPAIQEFWGKFRGSHLSAGTFGWIKAAVPGAPGSNNSIEAINHALKALVDWKTSPVRFRVFSSVL